MMVQLTAFEDEVFNAWNLSISKKITQSLNRYFLSLANKRIVWGGRLTYPCVLEVQKMKQEFPNLKFWENLGKIPKIQYWTGNFLLGTEICYQEKSWILVHFKTIQDFSRVVLSSLVTVSAIREVSK